MDILLFIVVLVVLIVVHELGHFFVAKLCKMRVDEFGVGYPPRAYAIKKGETEYSLNWLPFGGFVKIFGEDLDARDEKESHRSFSARPRIQQALVLVAGIAMNLIFAWVLLSSTLAVGVPRALTPEQAQNAPDAVLTIAEVLPNSPATDAGLLPGDAIESVTVQGDVFTHYDAQAFTDLLATEIDGVVLEVKGADGVTRTVEATPRTGVIAAAPSRVALGVSLVTVGTISVPWYQAPIDGFVLTWELTKQTAVGLAQFFASIFTLSADLSQVSGPIGIAGAVGNASDSGFASLIALTAIISINLALINILPFPALDGGRLLFVIIEAVTRRPIKPIVANTLNMVGFGLLILLMLVITVSDVFKIVG
ncbi:M50 family metallopeptidase [Patescibacteria group bacterium]|nr:M50 family metallopeptidase [Patescibacteria group bacterium]MBU1755163.1 M50 family metallopeptidase [Patescibacteria group bacterium]